MYQVALRNRSLRILAIAESVSSIGSWVTMMAVFAMVVFQGEGTVAESSGVFLAGLVPGLVASPVAGWLTDRFDRKRLMIISELLSGLFVAGLIVVQRLEFVYGLLVLQALSMTIMTPARQASVPALVERHELSRANAFLQQLAGIIKIGAPILAGALLALVTPQQAIVVDVLSFALSAIILSRLPALPPSRSQVASEGAGSPGRSVGVALKSSWSLRFLFVLTFLAILVIIGLDVLSSVYVRDVLLGDEGLYGLIIGLIGLGTVGATVLLMGRKGESSPWRDLLTGLALLALIPASLAVAVWLEQVWLARALVLGASLVGGVGNGLITVQASTLLQLLSPADLLGRISGVFQSVTIAGQLMGMVLVPVLVPGLLSMDLYFLLSGVLLAVLVAYAALSLRRVAVLRGVNP
jgi:MFS family permease